MNSIKELGYSLCTVIEQIPKGILVFFSSFEQLNKAVQVWRDSDIWFKITNMKSVIVDSQMTEGTSVKRYYDQVKTKKGAILMAVMRGKASEGLDFKDEYARAVIIVGVPYPNIKGQNIIMIRTE